MRIQYDASYGHRYLSYLQKERHRLATNSFHCKAMFLTCFTLLLTLQYKVVSKKTENIDSLRGYVDTECNHLVRLIRGGISTNRSAIASYGEYDIEKSICWDIADRAHVNELELDLKFKINSRLKDIQSSQPSMANGLGIQDFVLAHIWPITMSILFVLFFVSDFLINIRKYKYIEATRDFFQTLDEFGYYRRMYEDDYPRIGWAEGISQIAALFWSYKWYLCIDGALYFGVLLVSLLLWHANFFPYQLGNVGV